MKVVCIGGGGAALVALRVMKAKNPDVEPVLLTERDVGGYRPCELTYVLSGEIATYEEIALLTDEERAAFRFGRSATAIDPDARTVAAAGPDGAVETYPFDRLLIASGARPAMPPVPGLDDPSVKERTAALSTDMSTFKRLCTLAADAKTAVVMGAGAIGLEVAEGLRAQGLDVTVFEVAPRPLLRAFDEVPAQAIVETMTGLGVDLRLDTAIEGIEARGDGGGVRITAGGEAMDADLIAVCAGFKPNVEIARDAGIALGGTGFIACDQYRRTSVEGVYASGDCAESFNLVTNRAEPNMLAINAVVTGKIAGHNIALGDSRTVGGFVPSIIVRLGGHFFGAVGLTEEQALALGYDAASATHTAPGKPKNLGGVPVNVKLVAERGTGRLLGAQMWSTESVAGELDRLALAIEHRLGTDALSVSISCYTPAVTMPYTPVSQALDKLLPLL